MYRIGEGYDTHRLVEGRKLILAGVTIPYLKGLLGHSDADVLTHAIIDSILGALALGDIGRHFPDSDDRFKGISSIVLLKEVKKIIGNVEICNIDSTVICEMPKLMPYIDSMRDNIAKALEIDVNRVSIKATTDEGLGFTGEGLGIVARAITLINDNL